MKELAHNVAPPVEGNSSAPSIFDSMGFAGSLKEKQADVWALVVAVALHTWGGASAVTSLHDLGFFANAVRAETAARLETTIDIETTKPEEPEPAEPEPEPEPVVEEPQDLPPPLPSETVPEEEAPAEAAEAGEVLTAEADPDEPLDLTNEGFISGSGTRFSGGVTAADGTSKNAVRNPTARGGGIEGARGKTDGGTAPPAADKSRPAGIPINANWNSCGFPAEADAEQINTARVRVVVIVGPDGKPSTVQVLNDPGYGFGQHVRRCAMRFTFQPGFDKMGSPTTTATRPFVITFTR